MAKLKPAAAVLDRAQEWLGEFERAGLLVLERSDDELTITAPHNAQVRLRVVGDRVDMKRVLLGTAFTLRIVEPKGSISRSDDAWEIRDRLGMQEPLTAESFYQELKELLGPEGPSFD